MKAGIDYIGICTPFYCNDGKGNFVFHKRSKKCRDENGRWDAGCGQILSSQTIEENVLREVKEEYGCDGKIQEQLPPHLIARTHNGKKTCWLTIPFFVLVNPKEVKINEKEKIEEIGWFSFNNLPRPLHIGFQYTFKRYRKYFDKYN